MDGIGAPDDREDLGERPKLCPQGSISGDRVRCAGIGFLSGRCLSETEAMRGDLLMLITITGP